MALEADSDITHRLNAAYEDNDSRLDPGLVAAQAEAVDARRAGGGSTVERTGLWTIPET